MPPKAKLPAPIDRPLSRAYVRQFTGWSTAEPPGLSDPTSLRIMENVQVNRDGSCRIRPGLRYLSYDVLPYTLDLSGTAGSLSQLDALAAAKPKRAWYQMGESSGTTMIDHSGNGHDGIYENDYTLGTPGLVGGGGTAVTFGGTEGRGRVPFGAWMQDVQDLTWEAVVTAEAPIQQRHIMGRTNLGSLSAGFEDRYQAMLYIDGTGALRFMVVNYQPLKVTLTGPVLNVGQRYHIHAVYDSAGGVNNVKLYLDGVLVAQDTLGSDPTGPRSLSQGGTLNFHVGGTDWGAPPYHWKGKIARAVWYDVAFGAADVAEHVAAIDGTLSEGDVDTRGSAPALEFVGTHEPFYLNDGTKAYLLAVREEDETVGFRVLKSNASDTTIYDLSHPDIDFDIGQPLEVLNFSSGTTYVTYLQIDNKIFALSDNGEPMRVFSVGAHKEAKALASITRPEWDNDDKLDVVHPDATWIDNSEPTSKRKNLLPNPSFELNHQGWTPGLTTRVLRSEAVTPVAGSKVLRLESKPTRTNLVSSPLHDVATFGIDGWTSIPAWTSGSGAEVQLEATLAADASYLKVTLPARKGTWYARSKLLPEVEAGEKYQVAYDTDASVHVSPRCLVRFFGVNGGQVGEDRVFSDLGVVAARWVSNPFTAPKGAVSARLFIGGENTANEATFVRAKNVMLCAASESTALFHGGSGANYFWTGDVNKSASVYHPPATVTITSDKVPSKPGKDHTASIYVRAGTTGRNATLALKFYNKNGVLQTSTTDTVADVSGAATRVDVAVATVPANHTQAEVLLTLDAVPRGEYHYVDAAMLEPGVLVAGTYFDGSTADTGSVKQSWKGDKHASVSLQETFGAPDTTPAAETRTADTLLSNGGRTVNKYSFGFFYTFDNEVGESAASKITVRRAQRAWADWAWETPNVAGEPSGTSTNNPNKAADQLVAIMPEEVYDEATAQGATSWNLYMFTWSDQDAPPVTAMKVASREIRPESTYDTAGWLRVTPAMGEAVDDAILPSKDNRYNFSDPSRGGQGAVVADRMVLVNDPTDAAVIRWSSNRMGEYTNFTASKGGGYKTLTSGNLYVPAVVKLWQNPQSADTITILCLGTDGQSTSYYMAPAQVASQSEAVNVMAFEETTATPGTTSPYGVEVFNNSLYHPLDDQLMKSTASNYNINHKSQTDPIRNMWEKLATKYWIMSGQHDSRLYYIVNNPEGALLEAGCKGNEIWVFDAAAKTGTWSRFLIQAHALRKIEFGGRVYMSVIRPDGVYYLDPEYGLDDVVDETLKVDSRAIAWKLEFNTQGANRAHDAWAHLQFVAINLGYFQGRMRYGLRSVDIHGKAIDMSKVFRDEEPYGQLSFDVEDQLQIRRDLREWYFYAESITDGAGAVEPSYGQLSLVQYRYAPSSVNTGYELGSVETFEYGRDVALAPSSTTTNGMPLPLLDSRRP